MVCESGHKRTVVVVIPTRKLNDNTIKNIDLFSRYFERKGFEFKIIVVSNSDPEKKHPNFQVCSNPVRNAAISRNIGVRESSIDKGTFIYLDDDIVLNETDLSKYLEMVFEDNSKSILAPYITGHLIAQNYRFNKPLKKYYSWIAGKKVTDYSDIQGKTLYSFCFPPIFSESVNRVEWIPGGFMTFREFENDNTLFDLNLFGKNYYMEDYYLSNRNFLSGIPILMCPVVFQHEINYNKFDNSFNKKFKETFSIEVNRLKIHRIRSQVTHESIVKFKLLLFLTYLYKLKALRIRDFASFIAVIYLLLCSRKKLQSVS